MGLHAVGADEQLFHGVLRGDEPAADELGTVLFGIGVQFADEIHVHALSGVVNILGNGEAALLDGGKRRPVETGVLFHERGVFRGGAQHLPGGLPGVLGH